MTEAARPLEQQCIDHGEGHDAYEINLSGPTLVGLGRTNVGAREVFLSLQVVEDPAVVFVQADLEESGPLLEDRAISAALAQPVQIVLQLRPLLVVIPHQLS